MLFIYYLIEPKQKPYKVGTIFITLSHRRKLQLRQVKEFPHITKLVNGKAKILPHAF